MGAQLNIVKPKSARPVFAGANVSVAMCAHDPDSFSLAQSDRLTRAVAAINRAGYKVTLSRVDDKAGLVTPSLFIAAVVLAPKKSIGDVAQNMVDLARNYGLVVNGARGVLFGSAARGRRGRGSSFVRVDADNTLGDVPNGWYVMTDEGQQAWINANLDVSALQSALNALPSSLPRLVVDGKYGPLTTARVREFQASKGLSPTGNVNGDTFGVLFDTTPGGTPPPPSSSPAPTSSSGSAWDQIVRFLDPTNQLKLINDGIDTTGKAVGDAANTVQAVLPFAGIGSIVLLVAGVAVGGIVLSKLANR